LDVGNLEAWRLNAPSGVFDALISSPVPAARLNFSFSDLLDFYLLDFKLPRLQHTVGTTRAICAIRVPILHAALIKNATDVIINHIKEVFLTTRAKNKTG
jgi:hypothetical protein